jgi:hypothetical protein
MSTLTPHSSAPEVKERTTVTEETLDRASLKDTLADPPKVKPAVQMSRRNFAKTLATTIGTLGAATAATCYVTRDSSEAKFRREGNITHVTTSNGEISLMYNLHHGMKNPDELPEGVDAVAVEMFGYRWPEKPEASMQHISADPMYEWLLQQNQASLLLVCPYMRSSRSSEAHAITEIAMGGTAIGIPLTKGAKSALGSKHKDQAAQHASPETRRETLEKCIKVAGLAWLATPLASTLTRIASTASGGIGNRISTGASMLSQGVHPEVESLYPDKAVYAAIMLQKLEWLLESGKFKHVALVTGANHSAELENPALYSTKKRLELIVQHRDLIRDAIDLDSIHRIVDFKRVIEEDSPGMIKMKMGEQVDEPDLRDLINYLVDRQGIVLSDELSDAVRGNLT